MGKCTIPSSLSFALAMTLPEEVLPLCPCILQTVALAPLLLTGQIANIDESWLLFLVLHDFLVRCLFNRSCTTFSPLKEKLKAQDDGNTSVMGLIILGLSSSILCGG